MELFALKRLKAGMTDQERCDFGMLEHEFEQWNPDAEPSDVTFTMELPTREAYKEAFELVKQQRDAARLQRDNAQALVIKIGLRLREYYRDECQGWTPGAAAEIYGWIDQ